VTFTTTNARFRAAQLRARKCGYTDRKLSDLLGCSRFSVRNWVTTPGSATFRPCPENMARQIEMLFPPDSVTGYNPERVRKAISQIWD